MFLTRNTKDFISNKHIYCMRDICSKCELHKHESYHFPNTLVFNGLQCAFHASTFNCLRGLVVSVEDSCFGCRRFRASAEPTFMLILFYILLMDSANKIIKVYFETHS